MKRTRIILADDHALVSDAIKNLLEPEFEVVATFANGRALVDQAPQLKPDVVLLDIGMPVMNGLIAGQRLKQMMPSVRLVYMTANEDADMASEAFRLGASGYLVKTSGAPELVNAIRKVIRGMPYVTPCFTNDMIGSYVQNLKRRKAKNDLTLRQKEVLQLLVEGRSMKEAAFILNVTPRTVAFHKYAMMEMLSLRTSAELIQYAMKSSTVPV